jgi:hypothetical protein
MVCGWLVFCRCILVRILVTDDQATQWPTLTKCWAAKESDLAEGKELVVHESGG